MRARVPAPTRVNGDSAVRSFPEFCSASCFRGLDGLRAIAIALVLLHHCPRFESPLLQTLQENGRHGVSLFFVISGFLICTLLLREQEQTGTIALGRFYIRRAARLLPLYYAVLSVYVAAVFAFDVFSAHGEQLFRDKLPGYLFYYSNWLPTATQGPFFFAWSLAVEEQFYLGFGLLLFLVPRLFVIGAGAAALLLKFAVYQAYGAVDAQSAWCRVFFSYQEPIILGVLLGFALHHRPFYEGLARVLRPRLAGAGIGILLAGGLLFRPFATQSTWDAQVLYVLMAIAIAGCALRPAQGWLDQRLIAHVGKVSYGIYLLHWLVLVAVARALPPSPWFPCFCLAGTLVIVVTIASAVHRSFEAPIIAFFKRRYSRHTRIAAAPAVAAVPRVTPGVAIRPLPPG